ncbi:MAG: sigma-54-dependent Fis family transcriptional regulator [Gemmatimonadetes bacterium]|nr:MAG: sigma-54-dependent Fis family transcriptional regulator [Gemmatimonadota bacterium]
MAHILIVDNKKNMLTVLRMMLEEEGHTIRTATDGLTALETFKLIECHLVISDIRMSNMDGMQLMSEIKQIAPDVPVVLITAHGSIESAVEAMRQGAFDYITKPFEVNQIKSTVAKALEVYDLRRENRQLREEVRQQYEFRNIISRNSKMQHIFEIVRQVAPTPTTVLILGESGTGKELIAKAIHGLSDRAHQPFVKINCAAIPHDLLESELFGYEKGAFTGAHQQKKGKFELANGGTLFLDEIGDMQLSLQAKILRALQEQEFERVGGISPIKVDVRIIAATNQNLQQLMDTGKFRQDLYYRLSVVQIHLPPLAERKDDIPLLAQHFLEQYNRQLNKQTVLSAETYRLLTHYSWPGNIRELQNVIERAVVLSPTETITPTALPETFEKMNSEPTDSENYLRRLENGETLPELIEDIEKQIIAKALATSKDVQAQAARLLGVSRSHLHYKLKKYGLISDDETETD